MWCFIFMERKRASNFRAVLPGCSRAKPKPPVILLRPLNCNVPSLSFKVRISSFSRKLRLVFRGNIFYHGLNGIGYASSTRSGIRCCKKDVVSISYVCLWDFLIHRKSFFAKERVSMMALGGCWRLLPMIPVVFGGVNTFLKRESTSIVIE